MLKVDHTSGSVFCGWPGSRGGAARPRSISSVAGGSADRGKQAGQLGAVLGQRFPSLGQLLPEQVSELGVLARLRIGVDQ